MNDESDIQQLSALRAVLAAHAIDTPADGDCLEVAPRVTAALVAAELPSRTITVTGLVDPTLFGLPPTAKIIGFVHQASRCGSFVLDGTARQFDPNLPADWVTTVDDYCTRLAAVTGQAKVVLGDRLTDTLTAVKASQPNPATAATHSLLDTTPGAHTTAAESAGVDLA